jgi:hypothetical protein
MRPAQRRDRGDQGKRRAYRQIERREVGGPGEFEALTDDELERAIAERVMRLGLALA